MKKLFALASIATLMFSCSKNFVETPFEEKLPINISVDVQTRANDTTFESGDTVGIYVVNYDGTTAGTLTSAENYVNNACFTLTTDWSSDEKLYWKDESTKADFYAYYPYGNPTDISAYPFSVKTDQSIEADYWASDFLWGKRSGVTPTKDAVAITTEHLFSNALVYIKAGEGYTAEELAAANIEVKIGNVKSDAAINLATGVATAMGSATEIIPWNTGACYRAMIVPQTISSDTNLISIIIDGQEYTYATDITFVAGTQHKIEVTISAPINRLAVDFSIKEWNVDDNIYQGEVFVPTRNDDNCKIYYTASSKVEPNKSDVFNVCIVSNEWNENTQEGVITFEDELTSIGNYAFYGCDFTSVTLPKSVTYCGHYCFGACYNMQRVYVTDLPAWCNIDFGHDGNPLNGADLYIREERIVDLVIPNNVSVIKEGAFPNCNSIETVSIPISVEEIGDSAFVACQNLKLFYGYAASKDGLSLILNGRLISFALNSSVSEYTIPFGVTYIGDNAFAVSGTLNKITIPESVQYIGQSVFAWSSNLSEVYCMASIPPIAVWEPILNDPLSVYWNAFYSNSYNRKIYVPRNSVEAYKSAEGWKDYADDIVGYDF